VATIEVRKSCRKTSYRARVRVKGCPHITASFARKTDAKRWAAGTDGVACMSYSMLKEILDDNFEEVEWVSVKRQLNGRYDISGEDGKLSKKLARNSFPSSVVNYIEACLAQHSPSDEDFSVKPKWYEFWSNN